PSSRSTIDVEPPNLTPANGTRKKSARAGEADASTRSAAKMTLRADGSFIETSLVQDEAGSDEQPQEDLHERRRCHVRIFEVVALRQPAAVGEHDQRDALRRRIRWSWHDLDDE